MGDVRPLLNKSRVGQPTRASIRAGGAAYTAPASAGLRFFI